MPGNFLDTNVLVYLLRADAQKAERAEALVREGGTTSVQVLNEITNVARRKAHLSWHEIGQFIASLAGTLRIVPLTIETHKEGRRLAERYGLSTYDAMIVAAALIDDCDRLWSEDMQHGLSIAGRLIVNNPFRPG